MSIIKFSVPIHKILPFIADLNLFEHNFCNGFKQYFRFTSCIFFISNCIKKLIQWIKSICTSNGEKLNIFVKETLNLNNADAASNAETIGRMTRSFVEGNFIILDGEKVLRFLRARLGFDTCKLGIQLCWKVNNKVVHVVIFQSKFVMRLLGALCGC